MTKEDLLDSKFTINLPSGLSVITVDHIMKFFKSNVCIPKGDNRHGHADIYHAFAEGVPTQYSADNVNWYDMDASASCFRRIKPSEPIYEWQFVFIQEGYQNILSEYMTDEELGNIHEMVTCIKIEETKRKRK